jgi:hypothetical protein
MSLTSYWRGSNRFVSSLDSNRIPNPTLNGVSSGDRPAKSEFAEKTQRTCVLLKKHLNYSVGSETSVCVCDDVVSRRVGLADWVAVHPLVSKLFPRCATTIPLLFIVTFDDQMADHMASSLEMLIKWPHVLRKGSVPQG